jgi:hypothetical protein
MNKILALLKAMGIAEAEAQKLIEASKDAATADVFDIVPLVKMATDHQRSIFLNDTEIIDKFKGEEKGKQLDIITRDLKKTFGLTSEEIKDKGIKEIIELARTKATTNTDKGIEQLQADVIALTNKVKDYEENIIPSKLAEVEGHKKKITIDNELTKLVSGKKLRVPFDAAFPSIVNFLSEKYDLDMDDKKQLNVFLKGQKVHPTKDDKTGLLGLNEILESKLKEWKFVEESNADQGTKTTQQVIVDDPNKKTDKAQNFPGAEKAKAALAEIKP